MSLDYCLQTMYIGLQLSNRLLVSRNRGETFVESKTEVRCLNLDASDLGQFYLLVFYMQILI